MSVILVTHDLGVVAGHTDEIIVMYAGQIVERAPTLVLYTEMRMPYTEALLESIPKLDDPSHTWLRAIAGRHEVLGIEILDPRDVELPPVGDVILQDTETGVTRDFTIDEQLRDDFEKAAAAHRTEVARTLRRCDAPLLSLRTDRDWIADVVRFVASRRRGALAGR